MSSTLPSRRRPTTTPSSNNRINVELNKQFEMSLSDLRKPMEDGTATTVEGSCNNQSWGFMDKSLVVQPLADTSSDTIGGSRGGNRIRDPSIKELQEVFAIQAPGFSRQAKARHLQADTTSSNSNKNNKGLGDKLQIDNQDSFATLDSQAARAGMDESEGDCRMRLPMIPSLDLSNSENMDADESLLDFESVCFEARPKEDHTRRSSTGSSSSGGAGKKYMSAFGTLAQMGDTKTNEILGKKKQLLEDISETGGKIPEAASRRRKSRTGKAASRRNVLKDNSTSMAKEESSRSQMSGSSSNRRSTAKELSRSRSRSPTARARARSRSPTAGARTRSRSPTAGARTRSRSPGRRATFATRRSERRSTKDIHNSSNSNRKTSKKRDESPPPLVHSPEETKARRTRDTSNPNSNALPRRVKSSEVNRPTASEAAATRRPHRRTKSTEDGLPPLHRRRPSRPNAPSKSPKQSFQEVAMTIDLDELTSSNHAPDHYYHDDEDNRSNSSNDENLEDSRASLLDQVVQVAKDKENTKQKRGSVMDNLLTLLLEDMGDNNSNSNNNNKEEEVAPAAPAKKTKPRKTGRKSTTDASQSSGSTEANSGGSNGRRRRVKS